MRYGRTRRSLRLEWVQILSWDDIMPWERVTARGRRVTVLVAVVVSQCKTFGRVVLPGSLCGGAPS